MKRFSASVSPEGSLEVLSQLEVDQLRSSGESGLYPLLRRCMLAVLNSGSESDDTREVLERFNATLILAGAAADAVARREAEARWIAARIRDLVPSPRLIAPQHGALVPEDWIALFLRRN